jgi:alanine racemase
MSTESAAEAASPDFGGLILRPNRAVVDLGAIKHNTRVLKSRLGPATTLFGAVKCNAYGLGLPAVAEAMLAGGADGFTLADPAGAISMRRAGIDAPILLYGGILPSPEAAAALRRYRLMCTVTDEHMARAYSAANATGAPLKVFAKVDAGLERLGIYAEEGLPFVRAVHELPGIELAGLYSHIHGSESAEYREWQLGRFERLLHELRGAGIEVPLRMSESSASLGLETGYSTNAVDPGHLLYGIVPTGRPALPDGFRPAFRGLTSRIIQVKELRREEFLTESPVPAGRVRRIGVIPMGRGDGLQHLTTGQVRVRGKLVPIVGRLSLEHARVDLTAVPGCRAGDEVEIISPRPETGIGAASVAAANHLDLAGLQVAIAPSIPRAYLAPGPDGS